MPPGEIAMKADEAAELMDRDRESDRFKQRAAVAIAFFAMVLAICGLGGSNAAKEALNHNVWASNFYSFYQAKNARQAVFVLAADELELGWLNHPAIPDATKQTMRERLDRHRKTAARYESEPDTRDGKKELLQRAREHEQKRDIALKQDPYFDYAEALLQIAIVLISVSIIAEAVWLSLLGGAVGLAGILLTVNGFTLLVEIPGLA
jgi:Na+(H+)/acetate symporter ActP